MSKTGRITLEHTIVDGTEWWEDNYGNIWHAATYSRVEAMRASKTLTNCTGCEDCSNCNECKDCQRCVNCTQLTECSDCASCNFCTRLYDCKDCVACCDLQECVGQAKRIGMEESECDSD